MERGVNSLILARELGKSQNRNKNKESGVKGSNNTCMSIEKDKVVSYWKTRASNKA